MCLCQVALFIRSGKFLNTKNRGDAETLRTADFWPLAKMKSKCLNTFCLLETTCTQERTWF